MSAGGVNIPPMLVFARRGNIYKLIPLTLPNGLNYASPVSAAILKAYEQ